MVHRSLMEPPGKAKKAETGGGGGGEPHHPHGAHHAREAMIEDSSLTGSKKKMSAQHHGSVGFLLASTALTGSVNKKSSIFGQGANHVDQAKTSIKKAVTGQKAQGAGPYAPPSPLAASFDTNIPAISSRGHSPLCSRHCRLGQCVLGGKSGGIANAQAGHGRRSEHDKPPGAYCRARKLALHDPGGEATAAGALYDLHGADVSPVPGQGRTIKERRVSIEAGSMLALRHHRRRHTRKVPFPRP